MLSAAAVSGRADGRQVNCVQMQAGRADFASERRTHRRLHGEQRNHAGVDIDCRQELNLSFTQDAWMRRAYGKCRIRMHAIATEREVIKVEVS